MRCIARRAAARSLSIVTARARAAATNRGQPATALVER